MSTKLVDIINIMGKKAWWPSLCNF